MTTEQPQRPKEMRLVAYVGLGLAAGLVYVVFDILSERRLESGTLTGALAQAHTLIDRAFPILAGGLFGVCLHYLQVRSQLSRAVEVASRAEALRSRLQKVERDQAVWVLAAAVLHELNNPLQALGLLLDELSLRKNDESERDELLERARAQTDRALGHLRALRAMRSAGEPEVRAVELDGLVRSIAEDLAALAAEEGLAVHVECEGGVHASADPAYLRTIVENLLDNSLHSLRGQAGRAVTVRVSAEAGRALVLVADDGPPLDPAMRAVLFEPLRTTKTQGLGLGLPIARALARSMRGELSFDDATSKAFRLELPLRAEP
ncbi:MAG TPA: HAMP domain-containing sensor histidine kinase [Polyangiaceae bacterium]|nr:HAMP domain-containing sensor histidine kinase [Polyangiaceae bacterium]